MTGLRIKDFDKEHVTIQWDGDPYANSYRIYWADKDTKGMKYKRLSETKETEYTLERSTHVAHYLKVASISGDQEVSISSVLKTPIGKTFHEQLEKLSRGLVVVKRQKGIFLAWRLMKNEVSGFCSTGLTGADFLVYKNGELLTTVTDSTNFVDEKGTSEDKYSIGVLENGVEVERTKEMSAFRSGANYIDLPLQKPSDGTTPAGEVFSYHANDMSIGDVDGDGEYEYFVKWDPSNSKDVSQKGYTGNCYIDCYKLEGRLLWRLDMGVNIRAGAHYTQFMVYDFNGDGKVEMAVKTAPGTKMIYFDEQGNVEKEIYITMPGCDIDSGYSNRDDYRLSAEGYYKHLVTVFMNWHNHPMVIEKTWPQTLEECFGIEKKYQYPLIREDAMKLVDYFLDVYALSRSERNDLRHFEGFIIDGPEYLTMFSGLGEELETIPFPYPREDDGLVWGDYSMRRIEPANRVDRFLSGVAYLDGERPYLIVCRGYYTRATIVAYDFFENRFREYFNVDSGHVRMNNPFMDNAHGGGGSDPVYGRLAGQGNHSLSTADVDGDGYQEIIYGAAVIDHDGSLLYSSFGYLPDGTYTKLGHGDAMHVADIDPDRPGLEIFQVFEGAKHAPFGYALRDAETGEVIFGEYAETDLGRCMVGDVNPKVRGLQTWVTKMQSVKGEVLPDKLLGTNFSIRWLPDMSTQIIDGVDLFGNHAGVINDNTHGIIFIPEGVATNNGTKGNPCLVADIFGDWREELLLRTSDSSAIRIFVNTDLTNHKLYTLMHDIQYRTGITWQNNCYNQPCYPKFYFASDTDWEYVL
ncbi:rhamnogalacturonan lyase [Lachnoclostridium phytofermentans]|uniref:FG-GAP repeat protein n=1 Tax=Lachnoclostridium phytofermentans (strain ATCC 700394 / DSM 18823 / ISDg) TaxID=357809 RepID=A9KST6_LACP7|nr:rhamnogalacturonan lyase [Lachnoclostridium phytofermentans]ABX40730.1 FG-GAP repeat protein [Lachnoclostridium phytofermentans ISDg]